MYSRDVGRSGCSAVGHVSFRGVGIAEEEEEEEEEDDDDVGDMGKEDDKAFGRGGGALKRPVCSAATASEALPTCAHASAASSRRPGPLEPPLFSIMLLLLLLLLLLLMLLLMLLLLLVVLGILVLLMPALGFSCSWSRSPAAMAGTRQSRSSAALREWSLRSKLPALVATARSSST